MPDRLEKHFGKDLLDITEYTKLCALDMITGTGLITAEELRNQTMLLMKVGVETSAFTVAFTLMLLGLHQDVQRKVFGELEDILGEDIHRPVPARDLKHIVYLEQMINGTMRLDYTLPAGTTIIIPVYLVHQDPSYYPGPDKFNPETFNYENKSSRSLCSFIPFTSGRRARIGKYYAYMAMKTMLSVVLRGY
ncbi:hypothetical protein PR048_016936 [Dryococelus australis]|uniref:Cytochrome P450 n=1 Tax=Dryococelus australis TaxID=614101 RepID=A0ABQ9H869_9NEOP|nr:hypothetical protein PR048_016936 [Dryococelus australis]